MREEVGGPAWFGGGGTQVNLGSRDSGWGNRLHASSFGNDPQEDLQKGAYGHF